MALGLHSLHHITQDPFIKKSCVVYWSIPQAQYLSMCQAWDGPWTDTKAPFIGLCTESDGSVMVTSGQTPITPTPLAGDWPSFLCQNLIGWTSHPRMLPVAVSAAVALMLRRACKHIGISLAGCIIQYFVRCTCPRIPPPTGPSPNPEPAVGECRRLM